MKKKWKVTSSAPQADYSIFSIRYDHSISPDTGFARDFTVLKCVDWVNVVALTPEGNFILVRQYRHGTREYTVEIPGGAVDGKDETPEEAARRELEEETGYLPGSFEPIGVVEPNPAFQTNRCHTFLARDAQPDGEMKLDPGEEIEVFLATPQEVASMVQKGEIRHSLVISALFWLKTKPIDLTSMI